ncbi:MBL fold metallo-hydrolase [Aeromicrobium ginsengisoli]|uniref:MBL fold metallo-hydrolase n=1 Tax=Aeromicrobium ginsengisoli TaxID=363867 RepID=A0A5M4FCB1_9ACTN|nr:MBL fold metallo-hydrolase [Aeromicrobium ginsengisoli]KAA1396043.1 MBL fold metallo-hydrolase [Aeromicrobium ginsengisoli]
MSTTVTDRASYVLAANPGIMTLDGTNTWILREPGASQSVVVDPGPVDETHLRAVLDAAGSVGLVLFTHRHFDHTEALGRFVELTGAPTRSTDPEFTRDAEPLVDGETIIVDGLEIEVIATPGHTTDSTCFRLVGDGSLLSGDTILGRGTTVIAHPDGVLGPYLDSMAHIRELVEEGLVTRILPGHGPVIDDPLAVVDYYLEHRAERLDQVRAAVDTGATTAREVVEQVYKDVDPVLWGAAELSVAAQLDYLKD